MPFNRPPISMSIDKDFTREDVGEFLGYIQEPPIELSYHIWNEEKHASEAEIKEGILEILNKAKLSYDEKSVTDGDIFFDYQASEEEKHHFYYVMKYASALDRELLVNWRKKRYEMIEVLAPDWDSTKTKINEMKKCFRNVLDSDVPGYFSSHIARGYPSNIRLSASPFLGFFYIDYYRTLKKYRKKTYETSISGKLSLSEESFEENIKSAKEDDEDPKPIYDGLLNIIDISGKLLGTEVVNKVKDATEKTPLSWRDIPYETNFKYTVNKEKLVLTKLLLLERELKRYIEGEKVRIDKKNKDVESILNNLSGI